VSEQLDADTAGVYSSACHGVEPKAKRLAVALTAEELDLVLWCCYIAKQYWVDDRVMVVPRRQVERLLPVLEELQRRFKAGTEPGQGPAGAP
jgi:hypothetical protein